MDLGVSGLKAIILGGSRGIGWYTAELLRREGASIALCARGSEGVAAAVENLKSLGEGPVFGAAVDLENGEATRTFCRDAIEALGGIAWRRKSLRGEATRNPADPLLKDR